MRTDRRDRTKIEAIRDAARARTLELCRQVLPPSGAYVAQGGRYFFCLNPARADRHVGSFFVWLTGDAAGGWRDMATGEQGDDDVPRHAQDVVADVEEPAQEPRQDSRGTCKPADE